MHNEDPLVRLDHRIPLGNWQERSAGIFCKRPCPWRWDSLQPVVSSVCEVLPWFPHLQDNGVAPAQGIQR